MAPRNPTCGGTPTRPAYYFERPEQVDGRTVTKRHHVKPGIKLAGCGSEVERWDVPADGVFKRSGPITVCPRCDGPDVVGSGS